MGNNPPIYISVFLTFFLVPTAHAPSQRPRPPHLCIRSHPFLPSQGHWSNNSPFSCINFPSLLNHCQQHKNMLLFLLSKKKKMKEKKKLPCSHSLLQPLMYSFPSLHSRTWKHCLYPYFKTALLKVSNGLLIVKSSDHFSVLSLLDLSRAQLLAQLLMSLCS